MKKKNRQKHELKITGFLLVAAIIIFSPAISANAQQVIISGKVTDQNGNPVSGVTVKEEGTSFASLTVENGIFKYTASNVNTTFIISKYGYHTSKIYTEGQTFLTVTIVEKKKKALRERTDSTEFGLYEWSAPKISVAQTNKSIETFEESFTSFADLMQTIPGVEVQKEKNLPYFPAPLFVRGKSSILFNQPLVIVDGTELNAGLNLPQNAQIDPLAGINTKDIDNITVLRDNASTAIYGSKGANGVILITTNEGGADSVSFSYQGQTGVRIPEGFKTEMMQAGSYFRMLNDSRLSAGLAPLGKAAGYTERNWRNAVIGPGIYSDHTLSVSGGASNYKVFLTGNLKLDKGIVEGSGFNSGGFRLNHSWRPARWFFTKLHLGFHQSSQNTSFSTINQFTSNPLVYASVYPPVDKANLISWPPLQNHFGEYSPKELFSNHPVENSTSQFDGNFAFQFKLSDYFSIHTKLGGSYNDFGQSYNLPLLSNNLAVPFTDTHKYQTGTVYNWNILNYFRIEKLEGKSHWLFLLGSEEYYHKANDNRTYTLLQNTNATDAELHYQFRGNNSRRVSALFARANYTLNENLDIGAVFRREALWRQNGDNIYGIFPSVSAGMWIYRNHNMQNELFSSLKVITNWGVAGAEPFHYFHYEPNNAKSVIPAEIPFDTEFYPTAYTPNVRWETSEEWEFGLKSGWLGNNLRLEVFYFERLRSNVAFFFSPTQNNNSFQWGHRGQIKNSGVEFEMDYKKDMGNWGIMGNVFIRSSNPVVLDFGEDHSGEIVISPIRNSQVNPLIIEEGEQLGVFQGYKKEGIFQSSEEIETANQLDGNPSTYYQDKNTAPGDVRFADLDHDGKIDENDKTILGSSNPGYTYKITVGAAAGKLDFYLFLDGAGDYDIFNLNKTWSHSSGGWGNRSTDLNYSWTTPEPSNTTPRLHFEDPNNNNRLHSGMVERTHYFRLNKIDIGYKFALRNKHQYARIYISASNLFTLTNYSGESPFPGGDGNFAGVDFGTYPQSKLISVGVKLKL